MRVITDGWWSKAIKLPSPNFNQRPDTPVDMIVIHNISLPPGQFGTGCVQEFFLNELKIDQDPYFREISDMQVSSHVLIERDGKVTQFVSFEDRAWHAGRSRFRGRPECNDFAIGIELEGTDDIPYSEAQYLALIELSRGIINTYPGLTLDRIVGHSHIAPERKTDPGPAFEWSRYKKALVASLAEDN
ncbi:MAG: 1,6-anhydro-N-acetylmuramyl-L-alanine amidase AmpD [Agarilytica sp.]